MSNGCSMMAMLVEMGSQSGQPYQPDVNHRGINYSSFHTAQKGNEEVGKSQKPLFESMVRPTPDLDFSNGDAIGIHMYEVKEGNLSEAAPSQILAAGNAYSIDFPDKTNFNGSGYIKGKYATRLSAEGVLRLLHFFGYRWMIKKGGKTINPTKAVVTLEVMWELLSLFDRRLATQEDFEQMIADFNLENMFRYDASVEIEENRRNFFNFVRSFNTARICSFDGKHRLFCMLFFCTGYYKACQTIKWGENPFQKFHDPVEFGGVPNDGRIEYTKMQVFTRQTIHIAQPAEDETPDMTREEAYAILHNFGWVKTEAGKHKVQETFYSVLQEFFMYVDSLPNGGYESIVKLDFGHFWGVEDDAVINNGKIMAGLITQFCDKKKKTSILMGNCESWEVVEKALMNALPNHTYPLGTKLIPKMQGLSTLMMPFVVLVKYFLQAVGKYEVIKRFVQEASPEMEQQAPLDLLCHAQFYSAGFLTSSVLQRIATAAVHVVSHQSMGRKVLQLTRAANGNPTFAEDLACLGTGTRGFSFPNWGKVTIYKKRDKQDKKKVEHADGWLFMEPPANGTYIPDSTLALTQFGGSRKKLMYSTHQTLLVDGIETINKYGWRPKFTPTGEDNKLLNLYLK